MIRFDRWLLEWVFEPLLREIEGTLGVRPLVTKLATIAVWFCLDVAYYIAREGYTFIGWGLIALLVLSLLGTLMMTLLFDMMTGRNGANPAKYDYFQISMRIANLFFTTFVLAMSVLTWDGMVSMVGDAGSIVITITWYFIACDRLPPKKRTVPSPVDLLRKLAWSPLPQGGRA